MAKKKNDISRKVADPHVYQKKYQAYSRDADLNKFYAIVAFFPLLFWWPLVRCPKSQFGREAANQGLWLLIMSAFDALLTFVLSLFWTAKIGEYYWYQIVGAAILALIIAFMFNGFMTTYDCRIARVPVLGKIKLIK